MEFEQKMRKDVLAEHYNVTAKLTFEHSENTIALLSHFILSDNSDFFVYIISFVV